MPRGYWLMKSERFKYSWDHFVRDGSTYWDGVRNYEARNNLASMQKGDLALYYHSNEGKEVVGVARVTGEAYQDPQHQRRSLSGGRCRAPGALQAAGDPRRDQGRYEAAGHCTRASGGDFRSSASAARSSATS